MASLAGSRIAEIKVKHHARQFGESAYGLSRIYKVLMDLITIKTILSFFSRPIRMFALVASVPMMIGIAALIAGMLQLTSGFGFVYISVALLYMSLAIALMSLGVIGELVYRTGNMRIEHFAQIKSNVQCAP